MEKQHLKRFAYGVSLLVLGIGVAGFFPIANTYAIDNTDCDVSTPCSLEITSPTSTELGWMPGDEDIVFTGTFAGELVVLVDGQPVSDDAIQVDGDAFTVTLGDFKGGEHTVTFAINGDDTLVKSFRVTVPTFKETNLSKAINTKESFVVSAAAGSNVKSFYIDSASVDDLDWELYMNNGHINIGEVEGNFEFASDEAITVEGDVSGNFTVTAYLPGVYYINIEHQDRSGNIVVTNVFLKVVEATTPAATTVTDVVGGIQDADSFSWDAYAQIQAIMDDPELTDEEKGEILRELGPKLGEEVSNKYWDAYLKQENTFGDTSDDINTAVNEGTPMATKLVVESIEEANLDESIKDALLDKLDVTFASNVKFYDAKIEVYDAETGERIGELNELTTPETVVISGFSGPAAGFKRVFKVIRYHTYYYLGENDEPVEGIAIDEIEDVEFDEATGSISFLSDKFGTFLVSYNDVLAASVNTGAATSEGASATSSTAISVIAVVALIAVASAVKFAKVCK